MLTPLKNMYEFQRRHSWTILTHCSGIYLEKLKKYTKYTTISNPAKIQANPAYTGGTADNYIYTVPSQNPTAE
jgi:hypothetical protein